MSDKQFVCPCCGSTHWGTSMPTGVADDYDWVGNCHGYGCSFEWLRRDDANVFVTIDEPLTEREEALVAALQHIIKNYSRGGATLMLNLLPRML